LHPCTPSIPPARHLAPSARLFHFLPSRHRTHPTPVSPLTLEQPQAQGLVTVPAQSLCTLLIAVGRRRRYTIGAHVTTTAFTHRLLPICTSHTKLRSRLHTHYGTRVPARRVQIATSRMQRGTGHPLGRVGHQLVECLERAPEAPSPEVRSRKEAIPSRN